MSFLQNNLDCGCNNYSFKYKAAMLVALVVLLFFAGCTKGVTKEELIRNTPSLEGSNHDVLIPPPTGLDRGNLVPDFEIQTIDGEDFQLSSFSKQGKPVLTYFMASWCPYCRKDFTELSYIYKDYKDDITIIAIDLDVNEDADTISSYKKQFPGIEEVKFAPGNIDILTKYKISHTTTKYAISRDGTILYAGSGAFNKNQWKTLLDALKAS